MLTGCGTFSGQPAPIESRGLHDSSTPAPLARPAIERKPDTGLRDQLYSQYEAWKGTPYRMGGLSDQGIDCSGLVYVTYKAMLGMNLPRSTDAQARLGHSVRRTELRTGDLVFFKTGLFGRHVGIYLDGGRFLHASEIGGVKISALDNGYWKRTYWQARRLGT